MCSSRLSDGEYNQLVGNIEELIEAHHRLNSSLEDVRRCQPRHQRLGQVFLQHGAAVRGAHLTYWAHHPRAVSILERHRDKLNSWLDNVQPGSAQPPGLMILTTGLSRPFRQLERLAGAIQEVQQHLEDDHVDRGDTQRSISFYKESASEAARARRQKELELEVLTGTIRDWEGDSMDQLGEIVKMGAVVTGSGAIKKDKYLVLFPSTLLMLSASNRLSAFIYEVDRVILSLDPIQTFCLRASCLSPDFTSPSPTQIRRRTKIVSIFPVRQCMLLYLVVISDSLL